MTRLWKKQNWKIIFFALGNDQLWFDAEVVQPELSVDGQKIIEYLALEGYDLPDHLLEKQSQKFSRFVLTFGSSESLPYKSNYEVGFFDGEWWRGLHGYRIYPDPTHWIPFPKPPRRAA